MKSTAILPVLIQYGLILVMVAVAVVLVLTGAWLRAHQKQVDAQLAHIQDATLRAKATEAVRWVEQDPDQMYKSGLAQRSTAIGMVTTLLGVSAPAATVAIDAAFQALSLAGQIVKHDPPIEVASTAAIDVNALAAAVAAALTPATPPVPATPVQAQAQPMEAAPAPQAAPLVNVQVGAPEVG